MLAEIFALCFLTLAVLKLVEVGAVWAAREIVRGSRAVSREMRQLKIERLERRQAMCRQIREAIANQQPAYASELVSEAKLQFGGSL